MARDYLDTPNDEPQKNFKIKLPKKSYKLRCIKCEFGKSKEKLDPKTGEKTGNFPMYTRTWEVVEPQSVKVKNVELSAAEGKDVFEEHIIAGLTVMDWMVVTAKSAGFVKADAKRLSDASGREIQPYDDAGGSINDILNANMFAILSTNVVDAKDEETGEPIILPDGSKKIDYQHRIAEPLG